MQTVSSSALVRGNGTSLHRQLFMTLRDRILRGAYAPGQIIGTEGDLSQQYGVSRITVRRAVMDLKAEGLLESKQGQGVYVRNDVCVVRPSATLSFLESLRTVADETSVRVLSFERCTPPADIAMQLNIDSGAGATHTLRLRALGEVPVMVLDTWLPDRLGKKLNARVLRKAPLHELLMKQGVRFGRVVEEFTAIGADPDLAGTLHCGVGIPLIRMTRLIYDTDHQPVQHLTLTMLPERSRILTDASIDTNEGVHRRYFVHGAGDRLDSEAQAHSGGEPV
ncbi:GntR family transcriptional regulator [Paraburkholderia sp. BL6669N2]|uniref:GntR family transcriptional regulator n=1 Tax=Paraburkholderia sp. BL6669N2 TaxID=1938807 RepID=UPI000E257D78|nr:GntR family transcriptional regulator [Paraburkholderia sp. BL6669N2]REG50970.1 GntR family transcriptional regulator [Paraburkholderia sp. BL6669N2]REG50976.1 GntR family transcriptional regulator [Paraburkholderia sp. BL6669N2]